MSNHVSIEIIGYISSCFTEKFGIPRQPGLVPLAEARLKMIAPYDRPEMFRGLDGFSHVWVQFLFHQAISDGWKTTVRPPRLGGKTRKGIWATRSPHRPNFIGSSAVALHGIEFENGVELILGGVDFLDQTPVIDIKPYLPSSDALVHAAQGWAEAEFTRLEVELSEAAVVFCENYEKSSGRDLAALITQVLSADIRPPSQRGRKERFGICLFDVNIRWQVDGTRCFVLGCERK